MTSVFAVVVAAFVSSVSFARFGLRPWQAVPLGLAAGVATFVAAAIVISRRRGS